MTHSPAPPPERWDEICRDMAMAFKYARESWFDTCVQAARYAESPVVNTRLGGAADMAMTAYQLYLTSAVLNEREYIPRQVGSKFVTTLWNHVCGPNHSPYQAIWGRIVGLEMDRASQVLALSRPVAEYIAGGSDIGRLAVLLGALSDQFTVLSHTVVAETFGDKARLEELRQHVAEITGQPVRSATSGSGCMGVLSVWVLAGLAALVFFL